MTCVQYKQALVELVASSVEPGPELHAHLQTCTSCRGAFEDERTLFASIDSSLRSSANAEVPASFIPAVRARILRETPPVQGNARVTDRLLWASTLAAAAFVLFIFVRLDRRIKVRSTDEQSATQRTQSPSERPDAVAKPLQSNRPITTAIRDKPARKTAITPVKESPQTENRDPEIIVPPDEEILLARYAARWSRNHESPPTLLTQIDSNQTAPLEVSLIQIAELDVKPLADDQKIDHKNEQSYGQEYDVRKE